MTDTIIPELFDQHGAFVDCDESQKAQWPASLRAAVERIRLAHEHCRSVEREFADCTTELKAAVRLSAEAQNAMATKFPKVSFHELWKETVASQRQH